MAGSQGPQGILLISFGDVGDVVDDDVTESFSVVGESDLSVSHFKSSPLGPVNFGMLFSFYNDKMVKVVLTYVHEFVTVSTIPLIKQKSTYYLHRK